MSGNSFILFGAADVPEGESPQSVRSGAKGWIEISDWSWNIEADHSNLSGTGAAVGKPKPGALTITHSWDTSSAAILTKIVQGKSFAKVYVDMLKMTGGDKAEQFFQIAMASVFITKVSTRGSEDGRVMQDVDMVFKEVSVGYKAQNNDGTLVSAELSFPWSIATMQTSVTDAVVKFS
ncbi:type VI secretion system tube protein Hcp [Variovorax ginsengisoli]|uniref:Type VI secretion system Hcp family effector n=1 Tax=Variovorax ginsengisoli TaxID=363844 RepID=A0ABT9S9K6_9BURK|nr:type VI secretion system tube protein Hcp [Variovorax ginsengisoli]MDP9901044.1 type VI secretion system Hcp family effector [Variovorax ginsengisoli]